MSSHTIHHMKPECFHSVRMENENSVTNVGFTKRKRKMNNFCFYHMISLLYLYPFSVMCRMHIIPFTFDFTFTFLYLSGSIGKHMFFIIILTNSQAITVFLRQCMSVRKILEVLKIVWHLTNKQTNVL